jgi:carbon storage regulator
MLVLSRKLGERIVIDGGIVVTVVQIKGNQVRIALDAPPHVGISREGCPAARGHLSRGNPPGPRGQDASGREDASGRGGVRHL